MPVWHFLFQDTGDNNFTDEVIGAFAADERRRLSVGVKKIHRCCAGWDGAIGVDPCDVDAVINNDAHALRRREVRYGWVLAVGQGRSRGRRSPQT